MEILPSRSSSRPYRVIHDVLCLLVVSFCFAFEGSLVFLGLTTLYFGNPQPLVIGLLILIGLFYYFILSRRVSAFQTRFTAGVKNA